MINGWVGTTGAMELLGITGSGMLFLQRAGYIPPDCRQCGRIRWRADDLLAQRDELRSWLLGHYPDHVNDLRTDEHSDTIDVSSGRTR